jgi:fructose 1,6-bisphosphate aldolase/phosphatase
VEALLKEGRGLCLDRYVFHVGDDIVPLLTHDRGPGDPEIHALAWWALQ